MKFNNFINSNGSIFILISCWLLIMMATVNHLEADEFYPVIIDDAKHISSIFSDGLAIDNKGRPHVIYWGDKLYYAYLDNNNWCLQTLEELPGSYQSSAALRIDSNDCSHIVFYDSNHDLIKYANNVSGSWRFELLNISAKNIALDIDKDGFVHIGYSDGSRNKIMYATNKGGVWRKYNVDNVSGNVKIYVGSSGIHMCYSYYSDSTEGFIKYATNISGFWETELVESIGFYNLLCSLKMSLDNSGSVHISYDFTHKTNAFPGSCVGDCHYRDFKHAQRKDGSWIINTIGTTGHYTSSQNTFPYGRIYYYGIRPDLSDTIEFYYIYSDECISFGFYSNGEIIVENVGQFGDIDYSSASAFGDDIALAVTQNGDLHMVYYDLKYSALKYSYKSGGVWENYNIDVSYETGLYASSIADNNENIYCSYYDKKSSGLKIASNKTGTWEYEIVDQNGDVGLYTSITLDSESNIHTSYYDNTNQKIKYITNASKEWIKQTLPIEESVTPKSSIAVDSNDNIYVFYCDDDNKEMKYLCDVSGEWEEHTIADDLSYCFNAQDVVIDKNDSIHVCYYDGYSLYYATNKSGAFITDKFDDCYLQSGINCSMTLDSLNNAHITYQRADSHYELNRICYATNKSGSWKKEILEDRYYTVGNSSIAIDIFDNVHIGYNNLNNFVYIHNSSGGWKKKFPIIDYIGSGIPEMIITSNSINIFYIDQLFNDFKYVTTNPDDRPEIINNSSNYNVIIVEDDDAVNSDTEEIINKSRPSSYGGYYGYGGYSELYTQGYQYWDFIDYQQRLWNKQLVTDWHPSMHIFSPSWQQQQILYQPFLNHKLSISEPYYLPQPQHQYWVQPIFQLVQYLPILSWDWYKQEQQNWMQPLVWNLTGYQKQFQDLLIQQQLSEFQYPHIF